MVDAEYGTPTGTKDSVEEAEDDADGTADDATVSGAEANGLTIEDKSTAVAATGAAASGVCRAAEQRRSVVSSEHLRLHSQQ